MELTFINGPLEGTRFTTDVALEGWFLDVPTAAIHASHMDAAMRAAYEVRGAELHLRRIAVVSTVEDGIGAYANLADLEADWAEHAVQVLG